MQPVLESKFVIETAAELPTEKGLHAWLPEKEESLRLKSYNQW
jgi:hypothetical protein